MARGMIDAALQNAASMAVSPDDHAIVANRVEYELYTVLASSYKLREHNKPGHLSELDD